MDNTKIQPPSVSVVVPTASSVTTQITAVATAAPVSCSVPTNKSQLLNQNFFIVSNNANLIGRNHNSIVTKGKVVRLVSLTPTTLTQQNAVPSPTISNNVHHVVGTVNQSSIINNATFAMASTPTGHHPQSIQIRPNLISTVIRTQQSLTTTTTSIVGNNNNNSLQVSNNYGNTTTAKSMPIIANIKMNPISNQSGTINQVHQIATVHPVASNVHHQTFIANKQPTTTLQMLPPIVSKTNVINYNHNYISNNSSINVNNTGKNQSSSFQPAQILNPNSTSKLIIPASQPISSIKRVSPTISMVSSSQSNSTTISDKSINPINKPVNKKPFPKTNSISTSHPPNKIISTTPVVLNDTNLLSNATDTPISSGTIINSTVGMPKSTTSATTTTSKSLVSLNLISGQPKQPEPELASQQQKEETEKNENEKQETSKNDVIKSLIATYCSIPKVNHVKEKKKPRPIPQRPTNPSSLLKPINVDEFIRICNEDISDISTKTSLLADNNGKKYLKSFKIFAEETLDRSSPELWPESVPGVVNFLASTSSSYQFDDDEDNDEDDKKDGDGHDNINDDLKSEVSNINSSENNDGDDKIKNKQTENSSVIKKELLDDHEEKEKVDKISMLNNNIINQPKTLLKSFSTAQYFLNSEVDFDSNDRDSDRNDDDDSRASSTSEYIKTNNLLDNYDRQRQYSIKNHYNNKQLEWQKDFDNEELSMLYNYGSLNASKLLNKIHEMQDLSYELGLENEREMARGRYLDILREPIQMDEDEQNLILEPEIDEKLSYGQQDLLSNNNNNIEPMIVS